MSEDIKAFLIMVAIIIAVAVLLICAFGVGGVMICGVALICFIGANVLNIWVVYKECSHKYRNP